MMFVILILGWISTAQAQEVKVKGLMFGDYYYVLTADEADTKYSPKRNAFQFRRLYLTYQSDIATDFAIRLRLEARDAGFAQGAKMEPFVKHGYLQWKKGLGDADLYLGLAGTPTWAVAEKVWDLLFITGLDYSAATNVHLMPNVLIESSAGRDANVQGRLTFYYKF